MGVFGDDSSVLLLLLQYRYCLQFIALTHHMKHKVRMIYIHHYHKQIAIVFGWNPFILLISLNTPMIPIMTKLLGLPPSC